MARQAEFDRNDVLEKAMKLFWEKGYEATSLSDLTERMGIKRQSLYYAFGSKHELYLEALERYIVRNAGLAPLGQKGPIRERLAKVFELTIDAELCDEQGRGCFLTNATLARSVHDESTGQLVAKTFSGGEHLFIEALSEAQQAGEFAATKDVRALAHHFMNSLNGLRVTAKASRERLPLENSACLALSVLD